MHEEILDNILHSLTPAHYHKKTNKDFPSTRSAEFCTENFQVDHLSLLPVDTPTAMGVIKPSEGDR